MFQKLPEVIKEARPAPKVELPAFAGAISTVGWWALEVGVGLEPPAAVVAASVVVIMGIVGWFAPPSG